MPYRSQLVLATGLANGCQRKAYVWRMNSLYDPDQTGTGHQPMAHDQWATLYKKYRVQAVKVTMRITATNVLGNQLGSPIFYMGRTVQTVDNIYGAANPSESMERLRSRARHNQYKFMQLRRDASGVFRGTLTAVYSPYDFAKYLDDDTHHLDVAFGGNPILTYFITAGLVSPFNTGAGDYFDFQLDADIQYKVKVYEPLALDQS